MDQNLIAPNMEAIAKDFGIKEDEKDWLLGGQIAAGFFIVGAPAALLVGYLADVTDRIILFAVVIATGELTCLLTYFSRTYFQMFLLRTLTGIKVAGSIPIVYSVLISLWGNNERVYVSTCISLAQTVGIAVGQKFAGMYDPSEWRQPFFLVPIPAIFGALLLSLTVRDPSRLESPQIDNVPPQSGDPRKSNEPCDDSYRQLPACSNEEVTKNEKGEKKTLDCQKVLLLLHTRTVVLCCLQGIFGCVPWGIVYSFLNDYLSADRGYSVADASSILFFFGIGSFFGQLFGGIIGQMIRNKSGPARHCLYMAVTTALGVPPLLAMINIPTGRGPNVTPKMGPEAMREAEFVIYGAAFFAGLFSSVTGPNVRAVLMNVTLQATSGLAFAMFALTDDVGKGGGPLVVSALEKICHGRRKAFSVGALLWLLCAVLIGLMAFTVDEDERKVRQPPSSPPPIGSDSAVNPLLTDSDDTGQPQSRPAVASDMTVASLC